MEEESPQALLTSVFTINTPLTPLINVISIHKPQE